MVRRGTLLASLIVLVTALSASAAGAQVSVGPVHCTTAGCGVFSNGTPLIDVFCGTETYYNGGYLKGCRIQAGRNTPRITCGLSRQVSANNTVDDREGCFTWTGAPGSLIGCRQVTSDSPTTGSSSSCGAPFVSCERGHKAFEGSAEADYGYCSSPVGIVGCEDGTDYYGQPLKTCAVSVFPVGACYLESSPPPAPTPDRPYPYTWNGCYTGLYPLNPVVGCKKGYEYRPGDQTAYVSYCIVTVGSVSCQYDRLTGKAGCDSPAADRSRKLRAPRLR